MSFLPRTVEKGTRVEIPIQILENSVAKDVTGYTFFYGVKDNIENASLLIGPITGTVVSAASGLITFILTGSQTSLAPFRGIEGMVMRDSSLSDTILSPPGGVEFNLVNWSVISV